jgi:hypothetical protein
VGMLVEFQGMICYIKVWQKYASLRLGLIPTILGMALNPKV